MDNAERIRELNDQFRAALQGGMTMPPSQAGAVVITPGITALPDEQRTVVLTRVAAFDDFKESNDPHGEHDFGSVEVEGKTVFWKIDYYDAALEFGSPDPADPEVTTRVLTIMLAEEY